MEQTSDKVSGLVVANKLIELCNKQDIEITHLKLQKLLYFVQHLYFEKFKTVLFDDKIVAWKLGPVVSALYRVFMDYLDNPIPTENIYRVDTTGLNKNALEIIEKVVKEYGSLSAFKLVEKTHEENSRWYPHRNNLGAEIKFI
jgi:uncharacterized phage-associated protein